LQLDELRTRLRSHTHVLWLWLAIDPLTKSIPVLHLGPRTQNTAHMVIHALRRILAPGCIPLFTSDGLNLYFYALTAHFGQWLEVLRRGHKVYQWQVAAGLIYGQVKKIYRRRKLVRVTHVMRLGTGAALKIAFASASGMVASLLSFCAAAYIVKDGAHATTRTRWQTSGTALPAAYSSDGSGKNQPVLDSAGSAVPSTTA
jgi:hypothetical protein